MKSVQSHIMLLGLIAFSTPTPAHAWRVTTVETTYAEPEPSADLPWLIVAFTTLLITLCLAETHAQQYVERQHDIDSYTIEVKVQRGSKTIERATFRSSDYEEVVEEALEFAREEQDGRCSLVFKPSITLSTTGNFCTLDTIRKSTLPHKPKRIEHYWESLERQLLKTFMVPEYSAPQPCNRVTYVEHNHVTVTPQPWYSTVWLL